MQHSHENIFQKAGETLVNKIEVTESNVKKWRSTMHAFRERHLGSLVLPLLPRLSESAAEHGLWADSAEFQNEITLDLGQLWKFASVTPRLPGSVAMREYCKNGMQKSVKKAGEIIESHKDAEGMADIDARRGRFVGDLAMVVGNYLDAITAFDGAIEKLSTSGVPENAIELHGMKADALVRNGQVREGIELSLKTYKQYAEGPLGQKLEGKDENRWVSWRAGCILKLAQALIDTDNLDALSREEKTQLIDNFREVYTLGTAPGIEEFGIRKGQLEVIWEILRHQGFTTGNIHK